MAQLTKVAFISKWLTLFATNGIRAITGTYMRDFRQDISDSFLSIDDNFIDEDSFATDSATKAPSQQSVKAYVDLQDAITAAGTDTYTATLVPALAAYVSGKTYLIKFTNANTGASTLNLNALGAKSIVKNGSTALASGDIAAGQVYLLAYDGTNLQIIGRVAEGNSTDLYNRIFEDFDVGPTGFFNMASFSNGGGAGGTAGVSAFGQDGTENAIGVLECPTGTSTAGGATLGNSTYRHPIGFSTIHTLSYRTALSALSDATDTYIVRLGYMNAYTTTAAATHGIYFRYTHGTNTGKWQAVCVNAGVETAADTTVAATAGSTFSIFKVVVNSAGTQADFYIDGVLRNSITTNIPTGSGLTVGQAAVIEKTLGGTTRSLYLDYVEKITQRTTAR